MAPRAKAATPAITTHHSMPAGGAPSEAGAETSSVGEGSEAILTRPKKLVLKPLHETVEVDDAQQLTDDKPAEILDVDEDDAPLVLESAADAAATSGKKGSAKPAELPTDKIELPLEDVTDELAADEMEAAEPEGAETQQSAPSAESDAAVKQKSETPEIKDPGEGAAAKQAVDANEARTQKATALAASGKYQVRIHESGRSRARVVAPIMLAGALLLAAAYYAGAEGLLGSGIDLPKFW